MFLTRLFPLYVFSLALIVRLGILAATYPGAENVRYYEDVEIATNLLNGNGYSMAYSALAVTNNLFGAPAGSMMREIPVRPSAIKTPAYPLAVAGVFSVFGRNHFFVLFIIHALLSAGTAVFVYLGLKAFSRSVAAISSIGFAVYPPFAFHAVNVPESTVLTLFLIAVFLYLLSEYYRNPLRWTWISAAVIGGVIAQTEAVAIPFVGLVFVYVFYLRSGVSLVTLRSIALAGCVACVIALPWMIRNYTVSGEFPMLRNGLGVNLLFSLRAADALPEDMILTIENQVNGTDEFVEDKILSTTLFSWIQQHPTEYLTAVAKNFLNFWWQTDQYADNHSIKYIFGRVVPYGLLLVFSLPVAVVALLRIWKKPSALDGMNIYHFSAIAIIVTYTGVYTLFGANNLRYHFPVQLLLLVLMGEAVVCLMERGRLLGEVLKRRVSL